MKKYGEIAMKHYKPIKCVVCSKTFTPTAANQNTCCEAHRQQRATEVRKIREKKINPAVFTEYSVVTNRKEKKKKKWMVKQWTS